VQALDGRRFLIAPGEVVPLGNQVAEWASLMAERDAAIHAAACLLLYDCFIARFVNLFPVANAN
jgi:hypothetical protein